MSTVLVTGGAGYIGSHTCKALAEAGFNPVAFDNLSNGHAWAAQWGPLVKGDIRDSDALDAAFAAHEPSAVIHFAGLIEVGVSVRDPLSFWDANVAGSACLLQAMQRAAVETIVFSSTAAVYGAPSTVPIPETAARAPVNPYGETKAAVERMLAHQASAHGLRYAALRYFNAAGADAGGTIGEAHDPESHLIPLVLQVAQGRRASISLFGTDYDTPDGTCVRDYIHVSDLADAHVAALRALLSGRHAALTCNLGTGRGHSVREVVEVVRSVTGHAVPAIEAARRAGDPASLVADASRAERLLGWTPTRSSLPEVVASAWRWHKSR